MNGQLRKLSNCFRHNLWYTRENLQLSALLIYNGRWLDSCGLQLEGISLETDTCSSIMVSHSFQLGV